MCLALLAVVASFAGVAAAGTIDPWLAVQLRDGAAHEFFVVLDGQADLEGVARKAGAGGRVARIAAVRNALRSHAARTQAPLRADLAARGIAHRFFYIVNALLVRGDVHLAAALAARPDVLRLEGNPSVRGVPLPEKHRADLVRKAVSSVTPGVTDTNAPALWALGFTGQGIVVGGNDTGVNWTHPALKPHYLGWNGITASHDYHWHDAIHPPVVGAPDNPCGYDTPAPCDDAGHGTHTIGTAIGDDGAGQQIGMAPGARWIACRNMDSGNGTPATYFECFEWFLAPYPAGGTPDDGDPARAPHVTVNSWGCPASEGCAILTLQAAVDAQRAAGIMTVAAAGNDGPGCGTIGSAPASYASTFTIGAYSASTQELAGFSSRGPRSDSVLLKPDLAAPGVDVRSALPGGLYGSLSGTSMATPHVAGAVALLWSARPQLVRDIPATEALLRSSAVAMSLSVNMCESSGTPNALWGYGKLDVLAAYNNAGATLRVARAGSGTGSVSSNPLGVACGSACSAQFASGSGVSLIASPDAGAIFTGWLGACTGTGACNVSAQTGRLVSATFAPSSTALDFDIDGDGTRDALTDGLLIVRHLFGTSGAGLTVRALGAGATFTDPAAVRTRLNDLKPLFDIDGDGRADPLTDGLLVIRYLFGMRGDALIDGALGAGAVRSSAPVIESHLSGLTQLPP